MDLQAYMKNLKSCPMFSFCPNSIRLISKRDWDYGFFSLFLSLCRRGGSDSCWGFRTKLSPHCSSLSISFLCANTLVSIRCRSGHPEFHDFSYAKEQLSSSGRKSAASLSSVVMITWETHWATGLSMETTKYVSKLNS